MSETRPHFRDPDPDQDLITEERDSVVAEINAIDLAWPLLEQAPADCALYRASLVAKLRVLTWTDYTEEHKETSS